MSKGIKNLKKFLHIGGSPSKKNGNIVNGSIVEKQTIVEQTVTTTVEINGDSALNNNTDQKIPLAVEDVEEYDETAMRCGGCKKVMKNGHVSIRSFYQLAFQCAQCAPSNLVSIVFKLAS